jgi:hypothetical protein
MVLALLSLAGAHYHSGAHMHTMQLGGAHMHTMPLLGGLGIGLPQAVLLAAALLTALAVVGVRLLPRRAAERPGGGAPGWSNSNSFAWAACPLGRDRAHLAYLFRRNPVNPHDHGTGW